MKFEINGKLLFTTSHCQNCAYIKKLLDKNEVSYTIVDAESDGGKRLAKTFKFTPECLINVSAISTLGVSAAAWRHVSLDLETILIFPPCSKRKLNTLRFWTAWCIAGIPTDETTLISAEWAIKSFNSESLGLRRRRT